MAEPTCTPVDLGSGATLENPCTGILGLCTTNDYYRARRVLQFERNRLVALNDEYNRAVGKGLAGWTPVTSDARTVSESGYDFLMDHPDDWWFVNLTDGYQAYDAIFVFTKMAAASHQAACQVAEALKKIGLDVPESPTPVPPEVGITDAIAQGTKNLADAAASGAQAIFYLVAGAALLGGGWLLYQTMRPSSPQVVIASGSTALTPPAPAPAPATSSSTGPSKPPKATFGGAEGFP